MKNNIIALPAVRNAGNLPAVRDIDDPDLFVNYVENCTDLPERRKARRDAHYRAAARRRAENEKLTRTFGTVSMFAMLGVTVMGGLVGQL